MIWLNRRPQTETDKTIPTSEFSSSDSSREMPEIGHSRNHLCIGVDNKSRTLSLQIRSVIFRLWPSVIINEPMFHSQRPYRMLLISVHQLLATWAEHSETWWVANLSFTSFAVSLFVGLQNRESASGAGMASLAWQRQLSLKQNSVSIYQSFEIVVFLPQGEFRMSMSFFALKHHRSRFFITLIFNVFSWNTLWSFLIHNTSPPNNL